MDETSAIDLDDLSELNIEIPDKSVIEKSIVDDQKLANTLKPEEEEMAPIEETEFSDCGSIESEGKPAPKIFFQIKQIPILQRAI